MGDDRASAYWEDSRDGDRAILRASSLGSTCEASLVRTLAGQPRADRNPLQKKFDEGHAAESTILQIIHKRYGWKLLDEDHLSYWGDIGDDGQVEIDLPVGRHAVRVHPDGIAVRVDGDYPSTPAWAKLGELAVVEVKALAESTYQRWLSDGLDVVASYKTQVAVEMLATGLPCVYGVGVKDDDGKVLADRVYVRYYTEPPVARREIMAKVLRIVAGARAMDEGAPAPECQAVQWPCPFYELAGTLCGRKRDKAKVDPIAEDQIKLAAGRWWTAKVSEEKAKARREAAGRELLELVDASCEVGRYKITRSNGRKGNVGWKDLACRLRGDLADDEWSAMQEEFRGARGATYVTVKVKEG